MVSVVSVVGRVRMWAGGGTPPAQGGYCALAVLPGWQCQERIEKPFKFEFRRSKAL